QESEEDVSVDDRALRQCFAERGLRVVGGCRGRLPADDLASLEERQAALEGLCRDNRSSAA
ncbi:MAG TPA: hypothetical protein VHU42_14875, partial [Rhodopila sp.]|nr:hypothetical protein [Rhodopila sp.]